MLVLDLASGGSLYHRLELLEALPESECRDVALGVARGLHHIHNACGLIHRGVCLENILLQGDPGKKQKLPTPNPAGGEILTHRDPDRHFAPCGPPLRLLERSLHTDDPRHG